MLSMCPPVPMQELVQHVHHLLPPLLHGPRIVVVPVPQPLTIASAVPLTIAFATSSTSPTVLCNLTGFAAALIDAGPILRGDNLHLERLLVHKLSYTLWITPYDGQFQEATLVRGGDHPDKVSANVSVGLPGNSWILTVYDPELDELLALRDGLIAMVVVVAFIVSSLLLLLLLSAKRASVLLKEQLVTNRLLQEEKVSREALLGRQLDLIACLEQSTQRTKATSKVKLTEGQLNTIDRIERARAEISDVRRGNEEDIIIQQLLAEGSFGK
ncbi:hypothetical protein DUNSADRAFT_1700, partial [Dunaliella salina]